MGDGVAVTPGTGDTIDTEQVTIGGSAVQQQRIVTGGASDAVISPVAVGASQATLAAANLANSRGRVYFNPGPNFVYIGYGTAVNTNTYTKRLAPGETWEPVHKYNGTVVAISSGTATTTVMVTEMTHA